MAEYAELAHAAIDELAGGRADSRSGRRHRACTSAQRSAELELPPAPAQEQRAQLGAGVRPARPRARVRGALPNVIRTRQLRVHPNDRRRVVRALELTELGSSLAAGRGPAVGPETRHPTMSSAWTFPATCSRSGSSSGREPMFDAGVVDGGEAPRWRSGVSSTAIHALGLREVSELPT